MCIFILPGFCSRRIGHQAYLKGWSCSSLIIDIVSTLILLNNLQLIISSVNTFHRLTNAIILLYIVWPHHNNKQN